MQNTQRRTLNNHKMYEQLQTRPWQVQLRSVAVHRLLVTGSELTLNSSTAPEPKRASQVALLVCWNPPHFGSVVHQAIAVDADGSTQLPGSSVLGHE